MTLIELREMCAKTIELFNDKTMEGDYMLDSDECAEIIRAIQLPEQEPIGVLMVSHDGIVSVTVTSDKWHQQNLLRLWNSEKLRHTAKLIYEAPPSLNSSNPTVNDSLSVAALEKQVEELETALRHFVSYANDAGDGSHEFDRSKSLLDKIDLARERAK